jgi:hypothetical protein
MSAWRSVSRLHNAFPPRNDICQPSHNFLGADRSIGETTVAHSPHLMCVHPTPQCEGADAEEPGMQPAAACASSSSSHAIEETACISPRCSSAPKSKYMRPRVCRNRERKSCTPNEIHAARRDVDSIVAANHAKVCVPSLQRATLRRPEADGVCNNAPLEPHDAATAAVHPMRVGGDERPEEEKSSCAIRTQHDNTQTRRHTRRVRKHTLLGCELPNASNFMRRCSLLWRACAL